MKDEHVRKRVQSEQLDDTLSDRQVRYINDNLYLLIRTRVDIYL